MKKRSFVNVATVVIGICLIAASFLFRSEDMKTISGVVIGVGAGLFGMGIANLLMRRIERNNPELEKIKKIEENDERNTMIRQRAKAKAGDITQWLIMVIAYITILISAPIWVTLAVVAVFLAYYILMLYFMGRYQKEM